MSRLSTCLPVVIWLLAVFPPVAPTERGFISALDSSPVASTLNDLSTPRPQADPRTQKRKISIEDLVTLRRPNNLHISPDGKYAAFVLSEANLETNNYRSQLFLLRTDGTQQPEGLANYVTEPEPTTSGALAETGAAAIWSPDSRSVIYTKQNGPTFQLWRRVVEDGTNELLVADQPSISFEGWSSDGTKFVYSISKEVAVEERQINKVRDPAVLFDGTRRLYYGEPWEKKPAKEQNKTIWLYDLATKTERQISKEESTKYLLPDPPVFQYPKINPVYNNTASETRWSPDRMFTAFRTFFAPENEGPGAHAELALTLRRLDQKIPLKHFLRSDTGVSEFTWSADSRTILCSHVEAESTTLYEILVEDGSIREVFKTTSRLSNLSFSSDEKTIVCIREDPTTPPEIARLDLASRRITTLFVPNANFAKIELPTPKLIRIKNKYGHEMTGQLILPNGYESGKRYPLVITTYRAGNGFLEGAVGDEYPIYVYAARGFVVFCLEVRPSILPSQRGNLEQTILRLQSPLNTLEIVSQKLVDEGLVDANHRGITGLSYGSEIVDYAISHSDLFQAAAASTGGSPNDPLWYFLDNNEWETRLKGRGLAYPDAESISAWKRVSSALNAKRIKTPLLIQPPDREMLIGMQLYKAMQHYGIPVEMYVYPNEGHVKSQPISKYWVYQRNLDWMMFWLQGKEDEDPAKRGQYIRWRARRHYATIFQDRKVDQSLKPRSGL
jgi:dipeptidyl aminopeptidase/acylaminoacyl peptidase